MIKNPEIKFEGQYCKDYLFPKYSGKFFIQAQKLKELKALKNYLPSKIARQIKAKDLCQQDYKQMKAEADYIKRIQDLKRKLEKQIKRYNLQKKSNQQLARNVNLSLDHKSSMLKLEQICVNINRQKNKQNYTNPQYEEISSINKKRYPKDKAALKYNLSPLKNRAQLKKKSKTEGDQMFELKNVSYQNQSHYFTNKTERLNTSEMRQLPPIQRKQHSLDGKHRHQNLSQNRYSLPSNMSHKLQSNSPNSPTQVNPAVNHLTPLKDYSPRYQSEKRHQRRFLLNFSQKNVGKRHNNKLKLLEYGHKSKQIEPFLKGWDYGQDRSFQQSDSIYSHQQLN